MLLYAVAAIFLFGLSQALLTVFVIRILYGRPMSMTELQALQAAIAQLQTDLNALAAAGVIAASALTPLTSTINTLDAQVKALLPAA